MSHLSDLRNKTIGHTVLARRGQHFKPISRDNGNDTLPFTRTHDATYLQMLCRLGLVRSPILNQWHQRRTLPSAYALTVFHVVFSSKVSPATTATGGEIESSQALGHSSPYVSLRVRRHTLELGHLHCLVTSLLHRHSDFLGCDLLG